MAGGTPLHDEVQPFALGTYALTGAYGPVDRAVAGATILAFLEAGGRAIDTADLYGNGSNEEIVGEAVAARRDAVFLCTKFGFRFGATLEERGLDARPERVAGACEASLRRLGTDRIDLYYLHRVDPAVPVEDTVGAMARLVQQGKVRHLGLCEVGPATFSRAAAVHPIAAVQSEYSIWSREPEEHLAAYAAGGAAFLGYAPLGRGFLSGSLKSPEDFPPGDMRRELPRFQGENFRKNLLLVEALREIAAQHGTTPAQLATAWSRRNGDATPVVGATAPAHVADAFGAAALRIPAEVWDNLDRLFPPEATAGARYPESAMRRLEAAQR